MVELCVKRYPQLDVCREDILRAIETVIACYETGGKVLICGNGGSSADSEHISGELMKGFLKKRPLSGMRRAEMLKNMPQAAELLESLQEGLAAIPLPSFMSLNSAFGNDVDPSMIYAQGVLALAKPGDILLSITTSGNSQNVVNASLIAKALGVTVIALTGETGGKIKCIADVCIRVPASETYQVQELHLPVYHTICAAVEEHFYD